MQNTTYFAFGTVSWGWRRIFGLLLLGLLSALASQAQPAAVQQTSYPKASRIGWANVKDYGAVGDGVHDDTRAIRRAITTYTRPYLTRIIVYFPDGNYLVSDSLRELGGYYDGYVTFQGQSTQGTVIRLKDNAPGFQDPANPRPVVYVTRGGNQSFNQYFFNLTINTGRGNPGAVALDYITNNLGAVKNVALTSGDGQGYCGLRMDRQWPGPGLIKNVTVTGFQYGVRLSNREYSMTFENLVLNNQSVLGLRNDGNEAIIRKLTSTNAVPVIESTASSQLVLLDGRFSGGSASTAAINNAGYAYLRNTTASGYANLLSNGGTAVPGLSQTEYSSDAPTSLFPYQGGLMLNLPVRETPEYVNNDTTQWANVRDYGAVAVNPLYGQADATAGIQAAFNSGKPVVYFPAKGDNGSAYQLYQDVTIPPTVKLIIGFGFADLAHNNGARLLVQQASPDPLIFERIGVGKVLNTSTRAVAFKHMGGDYDNGPGSGDLYLEDFVGRVVPSNALNLWARQLNTEVQPEDEVDVLNPGGNYWILGQKTEGRATVNKTVNGGLSEILGGLLYPASSFASSTAAALVSQDGCISAIFSGSSYVNNGFYPVYASETRAGATRTLANLANLYRGGCAGATPAAALRVPENPAGAVAGLQYAYYPTGALTALPNFSTLTPAKTGTVTTPDLSPRTQNNNYAFRYTGYVTVPQDGQYTFYTSSDDGSRLYIGNQLVVDNDGLHATQERSGTIGLQAGTHALTVTFFQRGGGQSLSVSYQGPGLAKQLVPAAAYAYVPGGAGTGLQANYYNSQDLSGSVALSRVDATVDYDWGTGSPAPGTVNADHFSARWTGQVLAPVTGNYTFSTVSDDGVRLWVNGQLLVDNWTDHAPATDNSPSVALTAGQRYDIRLEYYENSYGAVCRLQWSYPGQSTQAVPQARLFPAASASPRSALATSSPSAAQLGALSVYPNPARDQLTVQLPVAGAGTLQLLDELGRAVRQLALAPDARQAQLDVRGLPAGLYLLQTQQAGRVQAQKVLIQP